MSIDNVTDFPQTDEDMHTSEPNRESLLMEPNDELLNILRDAHERIKKKKEERAEINKQLSAIYSEIQALGIDKAAAKAVFLVYEMDEQQRRLYDLSSSTARTALGIPLQGDLFHEYQLKATANQYGE